MYTLLPAPLDSNQMTWSWGLAMAQWDTLPDWTDRSSTWHLTPLRTATGLGWCFLHAGEATEVLMACS
jgi:hypothetical protein